MNNEQGFDEYDRGWRENAQMRLHGPEQFDIGDIDGRPLDSPPHAHPPRYEDMSERAEDRRDVRWREKVPGPNVADSRDVDELARSRDRQNERKPRDYGDVLDRRSRSKGYGSEDPSGRRSERSRSRERDSSRHARDGGERFRERSRERERRPRRDDHDSGYGTERLDSDYRSRRRSRSRDRDRDRRYRDSDRDRRYRDSDRNRPRRDRDRDRDRGERESSPKEVPWVPPPLPEHLRHLQVQSVLNPASSSRLDSSPWASALPVPPPVQNQFQNDGSFLDLFRQQMQKQAAVSASEDSNPSEGPSTSSVAEPAETVAAPKATPTLAANSSGLPVIARRRISKILKTGIVQKKKKEEEEEPEVKDGDGWSSYMKEVQRYRANKCIENEASRPPLVK